MLVAALRVKNNRSPSGSPDNANLATGAKTPRKGDRSSDAAFTLDVNRGSRSPSVQSASTPRNTPPVGDDRLIDIRPTWNLHLDDIAQELSEEEGEEDEEIVMDFTPPELPMREKIFCLFDGFPEGVEAGGVHSDAWTTASTVLSFVTLFAVFVSCMTFAIETVPPIYNKDYLTLFIIESVCIGWFTIDFLVRLIASTNRKKFAMGPMNWVDFVSILPYYIGLFVSNNADGLVMFRVLRLVRVVRVMKLGKHSGGVGTVAATLSKSGDALTLMGFLLTIALIISSSAIYFAEQVDSHFDEHRRLWIRNNSGQQSPFQSIPHTIWFCIVTMTTVGYGDAAPTTPLGKALSALTMLTGVFVLAFPTVILSGNFQEAHQQRMEQLAQQKMAALPINSPRKKKSRKQRASIMGFTEDEVDEMGALEYENDFGTLRPIHVEGLVAYYHASLHLRSAVSDGARKAIAVSHPMFPEGSGYYLTFQVVLNDHDTFDSVNALVGNMNSSASSVPSTAPKKLSIRVEPRPIERLFVDFYTEGCLHLKGVRVLTQEFERPGSEISVTLVMQTSTAYEAIVNGTTNGAFIYTVHYGPPMVDEVSLSGMTVSKIRRSSLAFASFTKLSALESSERSDRRSSTPDQLRESGDSKRQSLGSEQPLPGVSPMVSLNSSASAASIAVPAGSPNKSARPPVPPIPPAAGLQNIAPVSLQCSGEMEGSMSCSAANTEAFLDPSTPTTQHGSPPRSRRLTSVPADEDASPLEPQPSGETAPSPKPVVDGE